MLPLYMASILGDRPVQRSPPATPSAPTLPPTPSFPPPPNNLSKTDFETLLSAAGPAPLTVNKTLHRLFAEQVAVHPHAQAVEAWDGTFSYNDLDTLSKNLALQLVARHDVHAEDIVPFCMKKSKWVPVAVMAIFRAGGACAALDPAQPHAQLLELADQVAAKVIVTGSDCEEICHELDRPVVIAAERLLYYSPLPRTLHPSQILRHRSSPQNAAVIQFSSGSTGVPKAIVVEHVALASSIEAFGERWGIREGSRVFQYAAHTFDVAMGDLLAPLTRGGCVCIPSEEARMRDLAGCMRSMRVNWTFFTPTLAKTIHPSDVPSLRTIVMGGEAVLRLNLTTWADKVDLILAYGMAESSIYCSSTRPTQFDGDPANIGTPFGGRLWIVDEALSPVTPGQAGEMLIEGPTLAREYLNDPVRTAAAFAPTPSWLTPYSPHKTILRTGDMARLLADGSIQFAGRRDDHLKTRDLSTALGEIEHHVKLSLAEHVEDVVIELIDVADKYGLQPARLVAAYVPKSRRRRSSSSVATPMSLTPHEVCVLQGAVLRLQHILPEHTTPTAFVPIGRLPVTVSGKCNRKVLREILARCRLDEYSIFQADQGFERALHVTVEGSEVSESVSSDGIAVAPIGVFT